MRKAMALSAIIGHCTEIHSFVFRHRLDHDIAVSCALINTYSKSSFTESGFQIFGTMPKKNLIAYNTIISSLGSHGFGREALCAFDELLNEGFKPEGDTFTAVLCTCCHSGLIESGLDLFRRMDNEFGMNAQMEHYVYIVKLLGCGGMLEEAYELVQTMPMLPDSGVWGAMLCVCSGNGRSDLAEIAAHRLFEIDPTKTAYRVILSNMYASEEKWGDVENLRNGMMERSMHKIPGHSWIGDCSNSK